MIRVRPRRRALIAVPIVLLALAGCSSASSGSDELTAGPDAADPACTALLTRLPKTVLSKTRNPAQESPGIATWGDPAVELSCGADPTGPTADKAFAVNDVCWVLTDDTTSYTFLTYGRDPAVLVQVPTSVERTQATAALVDLNKAVAALKETQNRCLDVTDPVPTVDSSS